MPGPPYGVVLVGGAMTHQEGYGPGFAADPRARILGVTHEPSGDARRAELSRRLAEEMGVPALPDLGSALRRDDVHIVSVCSSFESRARVAARCAAAGKHIYLDKPLATTVEDGAALVEAAARAGVRGQMFSQIGRPYAQRARRVIASGVLGELRAIHCDLLFAKGYPGTAPLDPPRREHYPPTQFTFPDAKREIWTTASYSLALIRWLTGRREVQSVYATTSNYFFEEHHGRDIEDFGLMALTLQGGLTATVSGGRIGWQSHQSYGPCVVRLVGTKRSVVVDAHEPRMLIASDKSDWSPPPRDPEDPMGFWSSTQRKANLQPRPDWSVPDVVEPLSDQAMFLDAIEQQKDPEVSVADGAKVTEVMLAAYKSAATRSVIELLLG